MKKKSLAELDKKALQLIKQGKLKEAEDVFADLLRRVKDALHKSGAYYNWGKALAELARQKGDEALFRESFDKYALAVELNKDYHEAYYNWGKH